MRPVRNLYANMICEWSALAYSEGDARQNLRSSASLRCAGALDVMGSPMFIQTKCINGISGGRWLEVGLSRLQRSFVLVCTSCFFLSLMVVFNHRYGWRWQSDYSCLYRRGSPQRTCGWIGLSSLSEAFQAVAAARPSRQGSTAPTRASCKRNLIQGVVQLSG
jgi:hypothetical protein